IGDQLRSRALAGGSKIRVEEILFQPERSGLTI
ncbi:MAG TPA: transcription elongation factor GreAB, partial [Gimesia maris]|nr:transcription elongation factor GreAB [Gimesia maris]